jgi:hypothetical protein
MKKVRILILSSLAAFGLLFVSAGPVLALDSTDPNFQALCQGVGLGDPLYLDCSVLTTGSEEDVSGLANTIINIFSLIVGIISVIMIIVGGLRYITSSGDSNSVSGAKNTILYAIIGIVIVIFAQTLVKFVVKKLSD